MQRHPFEAAVLLAVFLLPPAAGAAVYKCVDAEGIITYSQAPCSTSPEKVDTVASGSGRDSVDCEYAGRFAHEVAVAMRNGADSSDIFDQYGGIDALSSSAVNTVNYVFVFRANDSVSVDRIGGLAKAKCRAGSLGEVDCENLPLAFTERLGGCAPGQDDDEIADVTPESASASPEAEVPVSEAQRSEAIRVDGDEASRQCNKRYQEQIDELDATMRDGYSSAQGEAFRERRRRLRELMRTC